MGWQGAWLGEEQDVLPAEDDWKMQALDDVRFNKHDPDASTLDAKWQRKVEIDAKPKIVTRTEAILIGDIISCPTWGPRAHRLMHDYIRRRLDQLENFTAFSSRHDSFWPYFMIAARNATQRNPRSVGQDATGWLTFKMRVPEPLFKELVYEAAPSSCFVVGKEQGPVLKPIWDDLWWSPSRFTIVCKTLVAVDRIVPSLDDMCLEDEHFEYTPTIFPKGTTSSPCGGEMMLAGVLGRTFIPQQSGTAHTLPAIHYLFPAGQCGVIVGERYNSVTDQYETLMLVERWQWPVWYPSEVVKVDAPLTMTYRRQHHRANYVTKSQKSVCQEMLHLKSQQHSVHWKTLMFALQEAKHFLCI